MSEYREEEKGILWRTGELNPAQILALSVRCPGEYAHPEGTLVYEVAWLTASKVMQMFGGCQKGIQQMLNRCGQPRAWDWKNTDAEALIGTTVTGTKLREYQVQGAEALTRSNIILGDEQGTGKTIQVLSAQHLCLLRWWKGLKMLVVVGSLEVADEWKRMAKEHFNKEVFVIDDQKSLAKVPDVPIVVINYAKIYRKAYKDYLQDFLRAGENLVVFDEAHRISGYSSQQHAAAQELCDLAWRAWFCTGTQVRQGVDCYHAMYRLVTRSNIKREEWVRYFARGSVKNMLSFTQQTWDMDKIDSLARIHPLFGLRRLKKDVLQQLPALIGPIEIKVEMEPKMATLYNEIKHTNELTDEQSKTLLTINEGQHFVKNLRLYQLTTHPKLLGLEGVNPTNKFEKLCEIIKGCGDQKVIIWGHFPEALDWIADELEKVFPQRTVEIAHGQITQKQRVKVKQAHQAGEVDLLIANPFCWAEGLTLTAASVSIYWDLHPSRVLWNQSKDRQHRWGALLPVTIYWLAYKGTVQVAAMNNMKRKDEMAGAIVGDGRDYSTVPVLLNEQEKAKEYITGQAIRLMLNQAKGGLF